MSDVNVVVHSRKSWTSTDPKSVSHNITPEGCTVHWGGNSPWGGKRPEHTRCASILRAYQSYHMNTNGWVDIAYNYAACPHGHVYELRGKGVRSAANGTNSGNQRSYAIVYIAGAGDELTIQGKAAIHEAAKQLGEPLKWVHSDWKSTGCPGDDIRAWKATGWDIDADVSSFPTPLAPSAPSPSPSTSSDWQSRIIADMKTLKLNKVTSDSRTYVRGQAMRTVQGALLARGYGPDGLVDRRTGKPDGIGGPATRRYVGMFQKKYRTGKPSNPNSPDYIVGSGTWRKLLGA